MRRDPKALIARTNRSSRAVPQPPSGEDAWDLRDAPVLAEAMDAARVAAAAPSTDERPVGEVPSDLADRMTAGVLARLPMRRGHLRAVPETGEPITHRVPVVEIADSKPTSPRPNTRIGRTVAAVAMIAVTAAVYAMIGQPPTSDRGTAGESVALNDANRDIAPGASSTAASNEGTPAEADRAGRPDAPDAPDALDTPDAADQAPAGDTVARTDTNPVPDVGGVGADDADLDTREIVIGGFDLPVDPAGAIRIRELRSNDHRGSAMRTVGSESSAARIPPAAPRDAAAPVPDYAPTPRGRVIDGNDLGAFAF